MSETQFATVLFKTMTQNIKKEFVSILQFILIPNLPPTVNGNPDEK